MFPVEHPQRRNAQHPPQAYRGIDPAVVPGAQIQDAGAVDFASTAAIDSAPWRRPAQPSSNPFWQWTPGIILTEFWLTSPKNSWRVGPFGNDFHWFPQKTIIPETDNSEVMCHDQIHPLFVTSTNYYPPIRKILRYYPLVNVYITMENHYFSWVNQL